MCRSVGRIRSRDPGFDDKVFSRHVAEANARLTAFFERSFSVDAVRRFKPAAEAYRSVADALGVPIDRLRLVAAHAWDVVGALGAGCAAAFVARPGKVLYPLGPTPDIVGLDFRDVAGQLSRPKLARPDVCTPLEVSSVE